MKTFNLLKVWIFSLISIMSVYGLNAHALTIDQMMNLPSDELVLRGKEYAEMQNVADSALMCFSIVTERYNDRMSDAEKKDVIAACNGKWFVYRFLYFDYGKAYENLKEAQLLYESMGMSKARLWLNYGCMFQTVSEPSKEPKLDQKAMEYYQKSFDEAVKCQDKVVMQTSMANLVEVAYNLHLLDNIASRIQTLRKMTQETNIYMITEYIVLLYEGLSAMEKGDPETAIAKFEEQLPLSQDNKMQCRYLWLSYNNLAKAYGAAKKFPQAVKNAEIAKKIAHKYDVKDAKIESYTTLSDFYDQIGDSANHNFYRSQYLQLKDTLLNYQQMAGIGQLDFIDNLNSIEKKMNNVKHQSQIKDIWLLCLLLFFILASIFVWLLVAKNRRLNSTNQMLYEKNVEMLRAEAVEPVSETVSCPRKYVNSNLTTDIKEDLVRRIKDVMRTSPEIYSSSFSSDRLAELVGENYKYISQVINECMDNNFNTLLNEYRVKEACKKIEDIGKYGHFTIEAIANSVGFQSTNSFRAAFKRLTGLSPSEFQRIARKKAEECKK